MPKSSKSKATSKDDKKKKPRKESKPTYKWCLDTGDKILITTVTVAEIKRAHKTGDVPNAKKKQLVRIPSKQTREQCYEEAASAIEINENQVLPTFGGRPWQVTCRVTEPNSRLRPPLFRWFRGNLELAVLPHLLEKVPTPSIQQKGLAKVMEAQDKVFYNSSTDLCERAASQLSRLAWNDTEHQIPNVSLKWLSPNRKTFNSRKSAQEHAKELVEQQVLIDKICFGHGARGQTLRPKKPSKVEALKAGKLRFLRDGLWVVGQEESWQEARAVELEKERLEQKQEARGKKPPKPPPSAPKRPVELFLKTQRLEYRRVMLERLREIEDKPHFTLGDADRELREVWRHMSPDEKALWKDAMDGKDVKWPQYTQDNLHGLHPESSESCSTGQAPEGQGIESGQLTTEVPSASNDVDTDHSDKKRGSHAEKDSRDSNTGIELYVREKCEYLQRDRIATVAQQTAPDSESTIRVAHAEEGVRKAWLDLDAACKKQWEERASAEQGENIAVISPKDSEESLEKQSQTPPTQHTDQGGVDPDENRCNTVVSIDEVTSTRRSKRPRKPKRFDIPDEPERKRAKVPHVPNFWAFPVKSLTEPTEPPTESLKPPTAPPTPYTEPPKPHTEPPKSPVALNHQTPLAGSQIVVSGTTGETCEGKKEEMQNGGPVEDSCGEKKPGTVRKRLLDCPPKRISQSVHWRLSVPQIDLCHDAATDHFEKVISTVQARGLYSELADGFDLLRERGRGRYDMELPAFDLPTFSFLTELDKTPWIDVVRQILGDEVVLIHKGVFLSNPGASAQNYHQDGPHLSQQHQRPCHAINVFVPLVDLTLQNGPTEFVAGSHILGYDDYDRDKVVIPVATAGTPIIFDYRLGHRGLANSSYACRPILYCTYAAVANGKEFRDSVNFSRKRYHRLGNLIEKPLSRDERARLRKASREHQSDAKEKAALETALEESRKSVPQQPLSSTMPTDVTTSTAKIPLENASRNDE